MVLDGWKLLVAIAVLVVWLLALCWTTRFALKRYPWAAGIREKQTTIAFISAAVAVLALLAMHLSRISVDVSQRLGDRGISIMAKFLFWPTLLGFFLSIGAAGKIRFAAMGSCLLTGLWWLILLTQAAISMGASTVRHPVTYRIPNGFVGEVYVHYGVQGAAPLPMAHNSIEVTFPSDGVVRTSSKLEDGWAHDTYLYYSATGQLSELKDTGWGGGGMIWGASVGGTSDGHGGMTDTTEQFFVGTEQQFKALP